MGVVHCRASGLRLMLGLYRRFVGSYDVGIIYSGLWGLELKLLGAI